MELIAEAWQNAWRTPDDRSIYDWARDYVDLPVGGYAIPGFFHVEKSRHLIEPFDALYDETIRMVSCLGSPQTGKSMLFDVWFPYVLANRPGPCLMTMQSEQIATDHAEVRLMALIRNCAPLRGIMPENRHKNRTSEIIFKNGVPLYVRGPALGNAQSKSIRYLTISEAWLIAMNYPGRIGDFLQRVSKYEEIGNSKVLMESQGGEIRYDEDGGIIGDDWAVHWHSGDQSLWQVACLDCGKHFTPAWTIKRSDGSLAGMRWDDNGGSVRYECPRCGQAMIDTDRTKALWNAGGKYLITKPEIKKHRSFQWPKCITADWEKLVHKYIHAIKAKRCGHLEPIREFDQKDRAAFFNEKAHFEVAEIEITTSDYVTKDKWPEEEYRFMTVDCQKDLVLFYAVIRAWSKSGESRRIWRGTVNSFDELRQKQEQYGVKSKFVCLDSGYQATEVYQQCCRHVDATMRGWVAFKDSGTAKSFTHSFKDKKTEQRIYSEKLWGDPALGAKSQDVEKWLASCSPQAVQLYKQGGLKCPLYLFSRFAASVLIFNLRDGKSAPWLSPAEEASQIEEQEYKKHMAGEIIRTKLDSKGNEVEEVHKLGPQHYLSCEKMQTVCATMAGVLIPRLK